MTASNPAHVHPSRPENGRADSGRNMKNASSDMGHKIRTVLTSGLVAGLLAVLAAPAEANRGGYVPPRDNNPPVTIPVDLEDEEIEEGEDPETDPSGAGVDVSPSVEEVDPGIQVDGIQVGADPAIVPAGDNLAVDAAGEQAPAAVERPRGGGILSKTGADALGLVRAGLAAVTLGAGLVLLGRRRRAAGSAA